MYEGMDFWPCVLTKITTEPHALLCMVTTPLYLLTRVRTESSWRRQWAAGNLCGMSACWGVKIDRKLSISTDLYPQAQIPTLYSHVSYYSDKHECCNHTVPFLFTVHSYMIHCIVYCILFYYCYYYYYYVIQLNFTALHYIDLKIISNRKSVYRFVSFKHLSFL